MRRPLFLVTDLNRGGTPTVIREIAVRLHRKNIPLAVGCLDKLGVVGQEIADHGVEVFALDAQGPWDFSIFPRLHDKLKEFDGVLSFLVHANAAARVCALFRGIPVLQSIQTTQPNPAWHWVVQRLLALGGRGVIVPSQSAADVAHDWAGFPMDKIHIIPNGVDLSRIAPKQNPGSWQNAPVRIGFLGRLDPVKCVPDLVDAFSLITTESTLHIFGDGPDRPRIEHRVAQRQLQHKVTLHGMVSGPQEAIPFIDILVLPSQAEGFGMVLIEAMAGGVNVVGTRVKGIVDVVKHESTGLLAHWNNPQDLAHQIQRLINDPPLAQRLAERARAQVLDNYDWDKIVNIYAKLIRETQ